MPGACYPAHRRLPGRDLHPLRKRSEQRAHRLQSHLERSSRHDAPRAHVTRCHEVSPAAPGRRARAHPLAHLPRLALSELLVAHDHHRARWRLDALVEHAAATEEFVVPAVLGDRGFELQRLVLAQDAQRQLLAGLIGSEDARRVRAVGGRSSVDGENHVAVLEPQGPVRSEEHTSDSSHRCISYAVFCLKKKKKKPDRILDWRVWVHWLHWLDSAARREGPGW